MKVCVIGAGIIGVSTAYNIQQVVQNVDVTIIADMFMPNRDMASYGPAGLWELRWESHLIESTPTHLQRKWGMLTYNHFKKLCISGDAKGAGITPVSGFELSANQIDDPYWKDDVDGFRHMTKEELSHYPRYKDGLYFNTYLGYTKQYIPWLMSKFLKNGGKKIQMKVSSLESLYNKYDVIVNCCGLRSQTLVGDQTLYPIRGQVYKVFAPWIKSFTRDSDESYYVIPGVHGIVTVGGMKQLNRWDNDVDPEDSKNVWNKCLQLNPSIQQAKVIEEWAGLRPGRSIVRLEKETISTALHDVLVVHNYGHGGSGVSFHWGCAQNVAQIIKDHLSSQAKAKL